jgi:hypothetical protein
LALVRNCKFVSGIYNLWNNILYDMKIFLTSTPDGGERLASRCGCITPKEIAPDNRWVGGWVGLIAGMIFMEKRKILPVQDFEPRPYSPLPTAIPTELLLTMINYVQFLRRHRKDFFFIIIIFANSQST